MPSKKQKINEVLSRLDKIEPGHKIIKNAATCKLCKTTVESKSVHDYRSCKCGAIAVDGGKEYLKRVGELDNMIEMSIYEDCYHENSLVDRDGSDQGCDYYCNDCGKKLDAPS